MKLKSAEFVKHFKFGRAFKDEMDSLTNNSDTSLCSSRFSLTDCQTDDFLVEKLCLLFYFGRWLVSVDCVTHQLIFRVGHRSLSDPSHHSRTVRCHHGTKSANIFPKRTTLFILASSKTRIIVWQRKMMRVLPCNLFQNANFILRWNVDFDVIYPKPFVRTCN